MRPLCRVISEESRAVLRHSPFQMDLFVGCSLGPQLNVSDIYRRENKARTRARSMKENWSS